MNKRRDRAFRATLGWQVSASVLLALVAGWMAGVDGVLSALLGGGIGVAGVAAFALVSRQEAKTGAAVVRIAVRAEAAKVIVIVLLLWWAFTAYHSMVALAFLGAFAVSVLLSGIVFALSGD